jgi:glucokinase
MSEPVLVGDVGGTWIRLALFDGELGPVWRRAVNRVDGLQSAVAEFLATCDRQPQASAVGVAGPVVNGACQFTNIDWRVEASTLPQPGVLINDLAAAAHGLGALTAASRRRICGPAPQPAATRGVMGVGTGHGQAVWHQGVVVPGEAGHSSFAADDPELAELAAMVRLREGRVSIESILSGKGMDDLLRFASTRATLGPAATEALQTLPAAAVVAKYAGQDAACARARSIFARALGSEAGNMALRSLPAGGVWLVGGVAQALVQPGVDAEIQSAFCAKPPMSERLRHIPLMVVHDESVALRGAAVVARGLLH